MAYRRNSYNSTCGRAAGRVTLLVASLCVAVGGCTSGSLATDSGPGTPWSTDGQQMVHVGEHVDFSFILTKGLIKRRPRDPMGTADYCIAMAGSERIEAELDVMTGHYRFAFDVVDLQPGDTINVSSAAYRRSGVRDLQQIGDTWVRADDPFDQPDRVMASGSVALSVYRTEIELPVGDSELDLVGGRLEIHRNDGKIAVVFHETTTDRGFTVSEPDDDGVVKIIYAPTADNVNKTATTYVRFRALDGSGKEQVYDGQIPTP